MPIASPLPPTQVRVDASAPAVPIDRRIYGHFLEELGRMISGGLFPEKGSSAPLTGTGYRKDVWEACRDLDPVLLRWPGGCFADVYRWKDGVGKDRPKSYRNRFWGRLGKRFGPPVHNELGTDEFLGLCRDWNCEPYFCANAGTAGPEEAAAWVEYLSGKAREGLPACKLWSIGNEQFAIWEHGHTSSRKYAARYLEFREAMKAADPGIETVANGADTYQLKWNEGLLEKAADEIDYLAVHIYLPQDYKPWQIILPARGTVPEWYSLLSLDQTVLWKLDTVDAQVRRVAGRSIPLAVDEWNIHWNFPQIVRPRAVLRDALGCALHLMCFQQRAGLVKIANLSSLVNLLCPPLLTDLDRCSRTPLFHVFRLFTGHARETSVPARVAGPSYSSKKLRGIRAAKDVPFLAASATLSKDRTKAALFLLNRHHEEPLEVEIDYAGASPAGDARLHTLTGPSITAENLPGRPEEVSPASRDIPAGKSRGLTLPPRSLSVLVQGLGG
ncbi:MAG: alpha-L-arabinofuranosidase C-terminal domain-containing protein [Bdellovibrionota bacterium]